MSSVFARTTRSLSAAHFRRSNWVLLLALVLLACWTLWFVYAELRVVEVSSSARLEVDREVHVVQAPVTGRIVTSNLSLGRTVSAGDILIRLDDRSQQLLLAQAKTQHQALQQQLEAVRRLIESETKVLERYRQATATMITETRVKVRSAIASAKISENIARKWTKLHAGGHISQVELLRAKAEATKLRGEADSLRASIRRIISESKVKIALHQSQIKRDRRTETELVGQSGVLDARIAQLKNDIEQRLIRAPISGRLGEVPNLRVGSVVELRTRVASIVPKGSLKLVAYFTPEAAMGRVRPGLRAELRLAGFSWTVYGAIPAVVKTVAMEPANRRVKVELTITGRPSFARAVPIAHGLPGSVEIEIERVSPAVLVLRAVGKLLTGTPTKDGGSPPTNP